VRYDPAVIGYEQLVDGARELRCATTVFTSSDVQYQVARLKVGDRVARRKASDVTKDAKAADQKHHLRRSLLRYLPLTAIQRTRVNSALGTKTDPRRYLSPRQRFLFASIKTTHDAHEDALDDLTAPESDKALADYQDRLTARLVNYGE